MKIKKGNIIKPLYIFLVFMFLYIPIMVLIAFSFNESKLNVVWTGFTFKWYESLLHNEGILEAVKNSFVVAIISTVISVVIGTLTAIGLYKYKFKGKNVLDAILNIPLIIPEIVMGISLLAFFSIVKLPLGKVSLIIAHVTFSIAYVVAVVKTRLEGYDKSVEEAASDLGATPRCDNKLLCCRAGECNPSLEGIFNGEIWCNSRNKCSFNHYNGTDIGNIGIVSSPQKCQPEYEKDRSNIDRDSIGGEQHWIRYMGLC